MNITTGVISCNSAAEWIWDVVSDGIDTSYEQGRIDLINKYIAEHQDSEEEYLGEMDSLQDEAEAYASEEMECWESSDGGILVGDWEDTGEKTREGYPIYDVKPDAEWAGIYSQFAGALIQVVFSKWAAHSHHTSPCFPGQADLDTEGSRDMIGYCLPPDLLDEKWYEENKHRIFEISEAGEEAA